EGNFVPQVPVDHLSQMAASEPVTVRYQAPNGTSLLLTYFAMNVDKRPGALELSEPLNAVDDFVRHSIFRKIALVVTVVAATFGLMLLLGIWLFGWPLTQLTDKARRVGDGDLSEPLVLKSRD